MNMISLGKPWSRQYAKIPDAIPRQIPAEQYARILGSQRGRPMTTTKADLIDHVAETENITKMMAGRIVDRIFGRIQDDVRIGAEVRLGNIGVFSLRETEERDGRNPQTGEPLKIKASKKIVFKAAKQFNDGLISA